MLVAVTGATGFVGARLVARLIGEEHNVLAIVRRPTSGLKHGLVTSAVLGLDSVTPSLLENVDAVVHCAVTESQEIGEARAVNRDGTRVVAKAALLAETPRFVHLSSAAIYDFADLGDIEIEESHPLVTHGGDFVPTGSFPTVYAVSKAEAEDEVRHLAADGLAATILRPTGVLGAGLNSAWGTRVPRLFLNGLSFPRSPDNTFGFIGVDDLVDAIIASIAAAELTTANVVGGHVPFSAYIDALERLLPGQPSLARETSLPSWRGSYSTQRLREKIGVTPKQTFAALMEEIADYWLSQSPAN